MPEQSTERYDGFLSFEAGVNTNVAPFLLPKNQLGAATNASMRGNFVIPRSPYQQIPLSVSIPQALYQGCCYYKPDSGLESIIVSIGGRLFEIIPSPGNGTAQVAEITISGDSNPAAVVQTWMEQAEAWMIARDGVSVPIYYTRNPTGGPTSTRRALQYQPALFTVTGSFSAPSVQGGTVTVNLSGPYTQGPSYPVYVGSSAYAGQTIDLYTASPSTGAVITLENLTAPAGKTVPGGTNIYSNPNFLGFVYKVEASGAAFPNPYINTTNPNPYLQQFAIFLVQEYPPPPGAQETIQYVTGIPGSSSPSGLGGVVIGQPYYLPNLSLLGGYYAPNVVVATTLKSNLGQFVVPGKGSTVNVFIQAPFQGMVGQDVQIQGALYQVTDIQNNVSNIVVLTRTGATSLSYTANYATGTSIWPIVGGAELPPGRMGTYGMGQDWFSFPNGISFGSGDVVGSSSGTPQYNFRDSVLKFTQNSYLATGGNFSVPGAIGEIQAMAFISNLDVSLGQGPLQVLTPGVAFSCQTDITLTASGGTWANVTNPILTESLISNGSLSQWSTVTANGDLMFRAPDGYRSLILGRRDFNTWGNVPISVEVQRYIQNDNPALLNFASSIVFDNRLLSTVNPTQAPFGVYHTGMVALNFDPISSLRGKQPSIWEGVWQDLNILQLVTGKFSGTPRAFAFNYNTTSNTIELWEILPSTATSAVPVVTTIELPVMAFGETDPRKREWKKIEDGELAFDLLVGPVTVEYYLRPDYDSRWQLWNSFTIPASPNYQPRCGLDKPPKIFDLPSNQGGTGRGYSYGFHYQVKLVITGQGWRLMAGRFMASKQPQPQFPPMLPKTPPA